MTLQAIFEQIFEQSGIIADLQVNELTNHDYMEQQIDYPVIHDSSEQFYSFSFYDKQEIYNHQKCMTVVPDCILDEK